MFNLFCTNGFFLFPMETLENQKFSDTLREYRKKPMREEAL